MKRLFTGLATAVVLATSAAAEMPVDAEQQSSMFQRIFNYDKHLRASEKIAVIVVAADPSSREPRDIVKVFRDKGFQPTILRSADLTEDLAASLSPESTVVYIMEESDCEPVKAFSAANGFLTISGIPSLAMLGHVSVSVDMVGRRPEVVVNMRRLETEGHEISAELLKLARVVR